MTTICYSGQILIEDSDFTLEAQRFIVRESEISFSMEGYDEYGQFNIEGVAVKTEANVYWASNLILKYKQYINSDKASIKIEPYKITKKGKCEFKGSWTQYGNTWYFNAKLKPINVAIPSSV